MRNLLAPFLIMGLYLAMAWLQSVDAVQVSSASDLGWGFGTELVLEATYIGSDQCISCHENFHPDLVDEYEKSGHPYKLNEVSGAAPEYPAGTSPGLKLPPNTTWDDFQYVIGGYGWKARFVKPDGRIYTVGDSAQYNLPRPGLQRDESWAAYHLGEDKKYDYACFQCHTTGATPIGSWNGVAEDSLGTFTETGVRCEGCHGPGSEHEADPTNVKPPIIDAQLKIDRCGDCHQRGGITNEIPVSGGYIRHHEQLNEMRASRHGDGVGAELDCASCHDPHVTLQYPDVVAQGMAAITTECETCHPAYEVMLDDQPKATECVDCHMARASKSAVGAQLGNGWVGDIRTHIMAINTEALTKDSMWTPDGSQVRLDAEGLGAVTLDFACLQCHTDKDVVWAANFASVIHTAGIHTAAEDVADVPTEYRLDQNYPNPFLDQTVITFALPTAAQVRLEVFGVDGRRLGAVIDQRMPPGNHSVTLGSDVMAAGVYFYELRADDFVATKAMIVTK